MKRRELVKHIHRAAKERGITVTEVDGGKHTKLYVGGTRITTVPRHNEISEMTARAIQKQCESVFGKEWWR